MYSSNYYLFMFQILATIATNFREAREIRDEEGRLEGLHDKYMEEAEKAERQAREVEVEAAR